YAPAPGARAREPPAEELQLGLVHVHVELDVDAPQPPVVRQLDREVAAALPGGPAAYPAVLGKQPQEAGEPVVPVVVAGDRVHRGVLAHGPRQGGPERPLEAVLVVLGAGARIHLVAAEHQDVAPGQLLLGPVDADAEGPAGQVRRHRHRRREAVAGVGRVVDPHLVAGRIGVVDRGCLAGLELALVEERPEHRRQAHVQPRPGQGAGAVPPDGLLRVEAQLDLPEAAGPGRRCVVGRTRGTPVRARLRGPHGRLPLRRSKVPQHHRSRARTPLAISRSSRAATTSVRTTAPSAVRSASGAAGVPTPGSLRGPSSAPPRKPNPAAAAARTVGAFSPTPPVNTSASSPPRPATIAAIAARSRYT